MFRPRPRPFFPSHQGLPMKPLIWAFAALLLVGGWLPLLALVMLLRAVLR